MVYDEIVAARINPVQEGADLWAELGLFAGFLRKWLLRGQTYGEKSIQLEQLYPPHWNESCKRNLDALVYLARLVNRRFDLGVVGSSRAPPLFRPRFGISWPPRTARSCRWRPTPARGFQRG